MRLAIVDLELYIGPSGAKVNRYCALWNFPREQFGGKRMTPVLGVPTG